MRSKKLKQIRRLAEQASQEWVSYINDKGTLKLHPTCGKAIYQATKRKVKRARR